MSGPIASRRGAHHRQLDLVQLDIAIAPRHRARSQAGGDDGGRAVAQQAGIGGQVGARRRAPQPPQRQPGGLAGDVPQRDVERRQRVDVRPVAAEQSATSWPAARAARRCRARPGRGSPAQAGCRNTVLVAATQAWPKPSPQPSSPWSVTTRTHSVFSACQPTPPNEAGLAPMSNGMRVRLVSTAMIFMRAPSGAAGCYGVDAMGQATRRWHHRRVVKTFDGVPHAKV